MQEFIGYMKEIRGVEWVHEVISERFDNALALMTPYSVIYGGAVRDALARKNLEGDLDIAVTPPAFEMMSQAFLENPRWVAHNLSGNPTVAEKMGSGKVARDLAPMNGVYQFINMDGMLVQLVTSNKESNDPLQSAVYPAREVDIVCCGVIMTYDGRVFEVLPNAHQDCIDGVLRLNESSETIFLDTLEARVEKLVGRGWRNEIDVKRVIKEITAKRERRSRISKKKKLPIDSQSGKSALGTYYFGAMAHETLNSGGHTDVIPQKWFGNTHKTLDAIRTASDILGKPCKVSVSCLDKVYLTAADGHNFGEFFAKLRGMAISVGSPKKKAPLKAYGGTVTAKLPKKVFSGEVLRGQIAKRPGDSVPLAPIEDAFAGHRLKNDDADEVATSRPPDRKFSYQEWKTRQPEKPSFSTETRGFSTETQAAPRVHAVSTASILHSGGRDLARGIEKYLERPGSGHEVEIAVFDLQRGHTFKVNVPNKVAQLLRDEWDNFDRNTKEEVLNVLREREIVNDGF